MIVFTSDHGDYLGDHWMGEKDLFHEHSAKIPLIVIDPSPQPTPRAAPCAMRWSRRSIWRRPSSNISAAIRRIIFWKAFAAAAPARRQARGLAQVVFSEYDYSMQDVRVTLGQPIERCRLFMVFDGRWKFIHASGFRPMLYDLETDPQEFVDRGADPACADIVARLQSELFDWALHPRMHITTPNAKIAAYADQQLQVKNGVLIGIWDEAELGAIREKIGMKP